MLVVAQDASPLSADAQASVAAVLAFWFGHPASDNKYRARAIWFQKNETFDEEIRQKFGALYEKAIREELAEWAVTPQGGLALIILLDQFSRNMFRVTHVRLPKMNLRALLQNIW